MNWSVLSAISMDIELHYRYAAQGVMVNFYPERNKVRFETNVDAARRAGLKISSHLLKLARIVRELGSTQSGQESGRPQ